jgi:hypothetical protein
MAFDLMAMLLVSWLIAGFSFRQLAGQRVPALAVVLAASALAGVGTVTLLPWMAMRLVAGGAFGVLGAAVSWRLCLAAEDRERAVRLVTGRSAAHRSAGRAT